MDSYVQISFENIQPEQQEVLIALLAEAGFEGFVENELELNAFIPESNFDRVLLNEIVFKYQLTYKDQKIESKNWNQSWESNFHPVVVGDFVGIRAHFHAPITNVKHDIIITPKMSFGTGHHATTYMMIEQMKKIEFEGKSVFDFGTGTGILAVLAEKLGAKNVIAVDNDPWSVENAKENIQLNKCSAIEILNACIVDAPGKLDIVLANINKNVILDNFFMMVQLLRKNGSLLLSGLLTEDVSEIQELAHRYELKEAGKTENSSWICLVFNK